MKNDGIYKPVAPIGPAEVYGRWETKSDGKRNSCGCPLSLRHLGTTRNTNSDTLHINRTSLHFKRQRLDSRKHTNASSHFFCSRGSVLSTLVHVWSSSSSCRVSCHLQRNS